MQRMYVDHLHLRCTDPTHGNLNYDTNRCVSIKSKPTWLPPTYLDVSAFGSFEITFASPSASRHRAFHTKLLHAMDKGHYHTRSDNILCWVKTNMYTHFYPYFIPDARIINSLMIILSPCGHKHTKRTRGCRCNLECYGHQDLVSGIHWYSETPPGRHYLILWLFSFFGFICRKKSVR